jgi:hypothetical protein
MNLLKVCLFLMFLPALAAASDIKGSWLLDQSVLEYKVTHPLHHVIGKSTEARGKGICSAAKCQFIIAVPVKSFDSGDNNRDLHMLQITKGADYPLIVVNVEFPTPVGKEIPKEILANLGIQFAGKKMKYSKVNLVILPLAPGQVQVKTVIPIGLKDFEIDPPSLLGVPIDNLVPIQLDMTWKKVSASEMK